MSELNKELHWIDRLALTFNVNPFKALIWLAAFNSFFVLFILVSLLTFISNQEFFYRLAFSAQFFILLLFVFLSSLVLTRLVHAIQYKFNIKKFIPIFKKEELKDQKLKRRKKELEEIIVSLSGAGSVAALIYLIILAFNDYIHWFFILSENFYLILNNIALPFSELFLYLVLFNLVAVQLLHFVFLFYYSYVFKIV